VDLMMLVDATTTEAVVCSYHTTPVRDYELR